MSPAATPPVVPRRVLEDASGARRRFLRRAGRVVALVLVLWLCAVFLGGIGVGPAQHVPFGQLLEPTLAPPVLKQTPHITPPTPAELVPALPAPTVKAATAPNGKAKSPAARGPSVTTTTTTATNGRSGSAPGHATTTTTQGNKPAAPPGQTTPKTHGKKP